MFCNRDIIKYIEGAIAQNEFWNILTLFPPFDLSIHILARYSQAKSPTHIKDMYIYIYI